MLPQFENLGLLAQFVKTVEQLGFTQPTPIQEQAIPALLEGRNVVGQAQTGTGKTAAYALPMLQRIKPGRGSVQALVLTPTRELAIQVTDAIERLSRGAPARVLAVYGGQSYHIQTRALARGVDVVVGTPGRLIDLIRQGILDLGDVSYFVLDEADEMLEMGFIEDVETILAYVPWERQIALFSATMPDAVRKLASQYVTNPCEIKINPTRLTVAETEQRYVRVREENKMAALTRLLETEDVTSALIFARTKLRAQELSDELAERGFAAEALHGDLNQARRETVLNRFRQHAVTLLVATDVAARGLDIEDVSHVFNYDAPDDAESYVHRIGRTGRAGKKGIAITFFMPRERSRINAIEAYIRQSMAECTIPTREEILARRDERFIRRLNEQAGSESLSGERGLVARLAESGLDLAEIAAAAIRLARAGEHTHPLAEISEPAPERRSVRPYGQRNASTESPYDPRKKGRRGQPGANNGWVKSQSGTGMVRLLMNLGNAHGLRPSDVVGAIASEVGIPGRAIGVIDIHNEHTFVDVAEKHVQQVLRESGGKYFLRGKPVLLTLAS